MLLYSLKILVESVLMESVLITFKFLKDYVFLYSIKILVENVLSFII